MIELKNLHIGYRTKRHVNEVFADLTAQFGKGELVGLVGNNGVGKSTLVKTMFGSLPPLKGDILLNGRSVRDFDLRELARQVSIVLTEKISGFNLNVFDAVAAGRIPYINAFGQLKEEDIGIIKESLTQMGISTIEGRLIDELSDGQRQKVMIAKSLAQQTPVILLDEPTAFLDYTSKQQLFTVLKQLCREQGKCIIVSSHDLEILFKNADKVLYLEGKDQYEVGAPSQIQPRFNKTI
jgi:iron complex transport system ATP-binding protein